MSKKITLATIKSFLRKNEGSLFVSHGYSFDGMTDCCQPSNDTSIKVLEGSFDKDSRRTLGFPALWFVGGGGDNFYPKEIESEGVKYTGFEVYNCCASFTILTKV
jgi:hypothetical protein